ncbi:hypothetical protein JW868_00350 [Candidatus Woesearchaeota archaeon]|nr:hypothetical protein [Candidatus Woesearchaeota archaeon]
MRQEKTAMLLVILSLFLLYVGNAMAVEPGGATVTTAVDHGEYNITDAGSINVEAGNISTTNLTVNVSTYRWVGVFGEVSGNIVLGDEDRNEMYVWTAAGEMVYACNESSVTWTSLADADATAVTANFTWLATAGDADNYTNTFNNTAENIGSGIFSTLTSDYALTLQAGAGDYWKTYSLTDGASIVFATPVQEDQNAYRAETADYQMILPENGDGGDTTADTYYFWVELV